MVNHDSSTSERSDEIRHASMDNIITTGDENTHFHSVKNPYVNASQDEKERIAF